VGIKSLLRNLTKLVLMGLGGVAGALAMVWARDNSDWVTIHLPSIMAPGSGTPIEYEARIYGIVAISFGAGLLSCLWIVLAIWFRAVRRERRLAKSLGQLEAQVAESRGLRLDRDAAVPALPGGAGEPRYDDFDELDRDSEPGVLSGENRLPAGYDDCDDDASPPSDPSVEKARVGGG
jgi:hypothetical protein